MQRQGVAPTTFRMRPMSPAIAAAEGEPTQPPGIWHANPSLQDPKDAHSVMQCPAPTRRRHAQGPADDTSSMGCPCCRNALQLACLLQWDCSSGLCHRQPLAGVCKRCWDQDRLPPSQACACKGRRRRATARVRWPHLLAPADIVWQLLSWTSQWGVSTAHQEQPGVAQGRGLPSVVLHGLPAAWCLVVAAGRCCSGHEAQVRRRVGQRLPQEECTLVAHVHGTCTAAAAAGSGTGKSLLFQGIGTRLVRTGGAAAAGCWICVYRWCG
jgi:hypothetical protein